MSNQLLDKSLILFFILLASTQTSSALQISEIMYDPSFDEEFNEWVEIYNDADQNINLENASLCGKKIIPGYLSHEDNQIYQNNSFILENGSFAVITDGGTGTDAYKNYNMEGISFHTETSTICAGLSNSGKGIVLSVNELMENISYLPLASAGNSISRNISLDPSAIANDSDFFDSTPTPGYANQLIAEAVQNASNETNLSDAGSSECDWKMDIIIEKEIFEEDDDFMFKLKSSKLTGSKTNISGEARLVNGKGDAIKRYDLFENYEATYSKTIAISNSQVSGEMRIEAELKTSCDDTDLDNNIATQYVYVKKNIDVSTKEREARRTPLFEQESRLEIDGSDDKAELLFYRGNSSKYAVYITLSSDGEKSKQTIHLKDKFSEYEMNLPFPKCSSENIVELDGLGLHEERMFVKENPCGVKTSNETLGAGSNAILPESASVNLNGSSQAQAVSERNIITGNSILNPQGAGQKRFSDEFDAKRTSLMVLLLLSIILNVLFIWYR